MFYSSGVLSRFQHATIEILLWYLWLMIVIVIPHRIGSGCFFFFFRFLSYCRYESPLSLYLSYSFSAQLSSQLSTQFYHGSLPLVGERKYETI
jgi:hypothetical protein